MGHRPPPARLPRTRRAAPGGCTRRRADRDDHHARVRRARLRHRRRRLLRHRHVPHLRRLRQAQRGRPDRQRTGGQHRRQAQPGRLRPVEVHRPRGHPPTGVGLAVGSGLPRLAHRVLGDVEALPGRLVRHPHRRHRPHRRAPHQRGGPERVGAGRAPLGSVLGAQRVPQPVRRQTLEVGGARADRRHPHRAGLRPAGVPVSVSHRPLPPATGLHLGGDGPGGRRLQAVVQGCGDRPCPGAGPRRRRRGAA